MNGLTADEVMELETLQLTREIAEGNLAREREKLRILAKSVNQSVDVLNGRLRSLER